MRNSSLCSDKRALGPQQQTSRSEERNSQESGGCPDGRAYTLRAEGREQYGDRGCLMPAHVCLDTLLQFFVPEPIAPSMVAAGDRAAAVLP